MEKNGKTKEWKEKEAKSTDWGSDWSETPPPSILRTNSDSLNHVSCESVFFLCLSYGKKSMSQQTVNCKLTVYSRTPGIIFFWNRRIQIAFGCECAGGWVNYCGISDMEHSIHHSSEPNSWTPILLVSTPDLPFFQNSNTPFHSRDICF